MFWLRIYNGIHYENVLNGKCYKQKHIIKRTRAKRHRICIVKPQRHTINKYEKHSKIFIVAQKYQICTSRTSQIFIAINLMSSFELFFAFAIFFVPVHSYTLQHNATDVCAVAATATYMKMTLSWSSKMYNCLLILHFKIIDNVLRLH